MAYFYSLISFIFLMFFFIFLIFGSVLEVLWGFGFFFFFEVVWGVLNSRGCCYLLD